MDFKGHGPTDCQLALSVTIALPLVQSSVLEYQHAPQLRVVGKASNTTMLKATLCQQTNTLKDWRDGGAVLPCSRMNVKVQAAFTCFGIEQKPAKDKYRSDHPIVLEPINGTL